MDAPVTPPSVLIIEDDQGCSDLISDVVQDMGYTVAVHDRAADAMAVIHEQRPILLVLDVMLPDGDGFAVLRAIRDDPLVGDLPVLLCTAALFEIAGMQWPGGDPHTQIIAKPFHIDAFASMLTWLLANR